MSFKFILCRHLQKLINTNLFSSTSGYTDIHIKHPGWCPGFKTTSHIKIKLPHPLKLLTLRFVSSPADVYKISKSLRSGNPIFLFYNILAQGVLTVDANTVYFV